MAHWQIQASGDEVTVDRLWGAEVCFQVTNCGRTEEYAQLTVEPLDGAGAWFLIDGQDRLVPAGGLTAYLVAITVPPSTPAGRYGLRAVVRSVGKDPDAGTATARVTLTVPPAEAPIPHTRLPRRHWSRLVVSAAVLLIGATAAWLFWPSSHPPATVVSVGNPLAPREEASCRTSKELERERGQGYDERVLRFYPALVVLKDPLPDGRFQGFRLFNQPGPGRTRGDSIRVYVLRPLTSAGVMAGFRVVHQIGPVEIPEPSSGRGAEWEYLFPGKSSMEVRGGDLIAFYGTGVPCDRSADGGDVLLGPLLHVPVPGSDIVVGAPFEAPVHGLGTVSFAARVVTSGRPPSSVLPGG